MKRGVLVLGAIFSVALALAIGSRMSVDATAVVVGVACGVLASVPTSLLLIWALRHGDQGPGHPAGPGVGNCYPPIVVVNPGQNYGRTGWGPAAYPVPDQLPAPGGARQFKVIGEAETPGHAPEYVYPGGSGRGW